MNEEHSEHKHEPHIGLDSVIRCRTCGEILPYMEEPVSKVASATRAKRVLSEIAVAGRYQASGFNGEFVIYSKNRNGLLEEITASKSGKREYLITKKTISVSD